MRLNIEELKKRTEELKKWAGDLAEYIINELEGYDLDFEFEDPEVGLVDDYTTLVLNLWGKVLPADINGADENVLDKFLEDTFNSFVNSEIGKIKYHSCDCRCYIFDKNENSHPINLELDIYGIQ